MTENKLPLNDTRLAAIFETAKIWSKDRCAGVLHRDGCKCLKRSPLSGPAQEMVEEIRRLRRIAQDTIEGSDLMESPQGPKVLIRYEHFRQLAEAAKDNERGEDDWEWQSL